MSWVSTLFKKVLPEKHITNSNSGKTFDEQYNEFGAFEYDENGFTITYEDFTKKINWDEITQLNVFKVDQMTVDRIDMEIVYGDKAFTISDELSGWHQFVLKTKKVFPTIPSDWDVAIVKPAFATNYRTIYKKQDQ